MKREHPKLGNYHHKFEFVEKYLIIFISIIFGIYRRVTGPVYVDCAKSEAAEKANKIKKEMFDKEQLCKKIIRALDRDEKVIPHNPI